MKRLLVIHIMFLYLFAVTGIIIQLHYCGRQLESWNVFAYNQGCKSGECGDESTEADGCCKNEVITAKVSQDQNIASIYKLNLAAYDSWLPQAAYPVVSQFISPLFTQSTYRANAPPGLWQHIPLYVLHSHLTYYG